MVAIMDILASYLPLEFLVVLALVILSWNSVRCSKRTKLALRGIHLLTKSAIENGQNGKVGKYMEKFIEQTIDD